MNEQLILGQTLAFTADPFAGPPEAAARHSARGGVLVRDGVIVEVGEADALRAAHPQIRVTDHGRGLILPGFVDAHMHYPQTGIIASWGKRLIDWLNLYTFPEEARLSDPEYAQEVAARTLDLALAHGTTTLCSYTTVAPHSVDAFLGQAESRGMRVVAGKTCMDRPETTPEDLRDTARSAYDDSAALIARWHGKGRTSYAISPRFSPTSTPEQLEALGALWAENPTCLMQTHLSEQVDEVAWAKGLYPQARDYLDTYESFGLLGERAVFGHSIHLEPRERARLRETGAGLVHCPTSNTFIGSGLFDMAGLMQEGQRVGLATDTGGGSSFSMLRTMAAAYEIGQLQGHVLHPAQLLWLATEGSAGVLHLSGMIGRLAPEAEADLVVLDLESTPAIAQRAIRAGDIWEAVFPTIMMGDDRAIAGVYIGGQQTRASSST